MDTKSNFIKKSLHLSEMYSNFNNSLEDCHMPRYDEFVRRYEKIFQKELEFIIRVPGKCILFGDRVFSTSYKH